MGNVYLLRLDGFGSEACCELFIGLLFYLWNFIVLFSRTKINLKFYFDLNFPSINVKNVLT